MSNVINLRINYLLYSFILFSLQVHFYFWFIYILAQNKGSLGRGKLSFKHTNHRIHHPMVKISRWSSHVDLESEETDGARACKLLPPKSQRSAPLLCAPRAFHQSDWFTITKLIRSSIEHQVGI